MLKAFNHLLHHNKKVDFIEQFNEKLLVKQENENMQISYHSILYLDKLVVDFAEQFNEKLFIKQILNVSSLLKLSLVCAETTL